jgi:hypothetical protein
LFRQEHTLYWRRPSNALGFVEGCALDLDSSLEDFDRLHLWTDVTGKENAHKTHTNDIQHPTLRFFHKWISLVLFPHNDNINVRVGDMQLIYAALKRKVVSPVEMLVEHWLSLPNLVGDVSCTSLITRIANDLGILGDATIISIDTPLRSSATITSAKEDGLRKFKKNCTISTIRAQSCYLTRDWVYIPCNLF